MPTDKKQISVNVEQRVADAIQREADAEDRSFGQQVARILRQYVDKNDSAPYGTAKPEATPLA